jgi:molybdenum-dependent DNA-binding transcriptional regulator ModE
MDENQKYEIIKKLVESDGNKQTAALKIGCSYRHINRLINGYKEHGKAFFLHGNRGRQPLPFLLIPSS